MKTTAFRGPTMHHDPGGTTASGQNVLSGADPSGEHFFDTASDVPDAPPTPAGKHLASLSLLVGGAAITSPVASPRPSPMKKRIKGGGRRGMGERLLTARYSEDESSLSDEDDRRVEERLQAARAKYQTNKTYNNTTQEFAEFSDPVMESRSDALFPIHNEGEQLPDFPDSSDPVLDSRSAASTAESQDPPASESDRAWQTTDVAPTPRVSNASPSHRRGGMWNDSDEIIPAPPTTTNTSGAASQQGQLFSSDFEENLEPFDFPLTPNHQSNEGVSTDTNTSGASQPKSPEKSTSTKSSSRRSVGRSGSPLKLRRGTKQQRMKSPQKLRPKTTTSKVVQRAKTPEKPRRKTPTHGTKGAKTPEKSRQQTTNKGGVRRNQTAKRGFFRKLFNKRSKPDDYTSVVSDRSHSLKSYHSEQQRVKSASETENSGGRRKSSSLSAGASTISSLDERREDKFTSIRSVKSGKQEKRVVAENIDAVARDRPQVFYTNDDVSTLTNPTLDAPSTGHNSGNSSARQSKNDPSVQEESAKEPQAKNTLQVKSEFGKFETPDGFQDAFFEQPDGISPSASTAVTGSPVAKNLRVKVATSNDPTGNSPLTLSTQKTTRRRNFKDPTPRGRNGKVFHSPKTKEPKGDSLPRKLKPMQSDFHLSQEVLPDPPLNVGYNSDSSTSLGTPRQRRGQFTNAQARSLAARKKGSSPLPRSPVFSKQPSKNAGKTTKPMSPSVSNAKSSSRRQSPNHLDMLTAAKLNAKTVAYLHKINGEPSPRHSWNDVQSDASSVATPDLLFGEKKGGASQSLLLAAYNEGKFRSRNKNEGRITNSMKASDRSTNSSLDGSQGSRSVTRRVLMSRRHGKDSPLLNPPDPSSNQLYYAKSSVFSRSSLEKSSSHYSVTRGFELFRQQREFDIVTGRSNRVVLTKTQAIPKQPPARKAMANEPNDPIKRASYRLLAKAAIPIQASCRRFLAQTEAVDRMWALYEIQSYMRRWRAEAVLFASIVSAVTIQAIFRGYSAQKNLQRSKDAAVLIQKIVRGFLASNHAYETIYDIVLVQAQVRGWITRLLVKRHLVAMDSRAREASAFRLQTWWRARSARMLYQFLVIDTIIAQSAVRRYLAGRRVKSMISDRDEALATKIQAVFRSYHVASLYKKTKSAIVIQAAWRGFQGYTDYIFCLVDILLIQRTIRSWIAKSEFRVIQREGAALKVQTTWRKYSIYKIYREYRAAVKIQKQWRGYSKLWTYKRQRAAVKIQTEWRCYSAFTDYIFCLADIIRAQRVVRAWITRKNARQQKSHRAATKVQATWRGHRIQTSYKDYLAARTIQTQWRRHSAYVTFIFSLAHIIVVQSIARSYLARRETRLIRMRNSATAIQKTWRRFSAQSWAIQQLASTLMLQSAVRRRNALKVLTFKRSDAIAFIETQSATKIQAAWRGSGDRNEFVNLKNGLVRLQSRIRGEWFRKDFNLQLGCCILIQSIARGFLVRKHMSGAGFYGFSTMHRAQSIREITAAKKIQFWWRVVLECQTEKTAALIIERFFIKIKMDIEEEIIRRQRRKAAKKKKKERKRRSTGSTPGEDKLLERAWLNTVDSNSNTDIFAFSSGSGSDIFNFSPSTESISSKSRRASPRNRQLSPRAKSPHIGTPGASPTPTSQVSRLKEVSPRTFSRRSPSPSMQRSSGKSTPRERHSVGHRASSPPIDLVMRHEKESRPPSTRRSQQRPTSTKSQSTVSSHRSSAALTRAKEIARKAHRNAELVEKLSLEDTSHADTASDTVGQPRQVRSSNAEHYRKKFGIQSAIAPHRFFADELTEDDTTLFSSSPSIEGPPPPPHSARSSSRSSSRHRSRPRSRRSEPPRITPAHARPSPRHGKIMVMNPYPDAYPHVDQRDSGEMEEFFGEEFSEI